MSRNVSEIHSPASISGFEIGDKLCVMYIHVNETSAILRAEWARIVELEIGWKPETPI